ncbi:MAG: hypothetical protein ABIR29_12255 [Chthoniobacterales bacterium]
MKNEASEDLGIYLKDHYAAAVGAVDLLGHLSDAHNNKPLGTFFRDLLAEVKADHDRLHDIMKALGIEDSPMRNAGAWLAEKFGLGKLEFGGGETSGIRLIQALETLTIGITGKLLLWRTLKAAQQIASLLPQIDFDQLTLSAQEQIEEVEAERLDAARKTFPAL